VKKIALLFVAFFVVMMVVGSAQGAAAPRMGRVILGDTHHVLYLPAYSSGGRNYVESQVLVGRRKGVWVKNLAFLNFNSERLGWGEDSMARSEERKIVRDSNGLWVRIQVDPTLDNDWGIWGMFLADGRQYWLNIDHLVISGRPWAKRSNMIRYGTFRRQEISFLDPGEALLQWHSNGLSGFVGGVLDLADVSFIRWNGDHTGWFEDSHRTCVPALDYLGHFDCRIVGMPNADRGAFHAVLKNGSVVWLDNSAWNWGTNVTLDQDGTVSYILPP
jgi:hypothetical protein